MDTLFSITNMAISFGTTIIVLLMWSMQVEQTKVETTVYKLIGIFSAAVGLKAVHNLHLGVFESDIYGILVRSSMFVYMLSNAYSTMKTGKSIMWRRPITASQGTGPSWPSLPKTLQR